MVRLPNLYIFYPAFLLASSIIQDDTSYFLMFFAEDDDDRIIYCLSNEDAITVHPTDATWQCKDVTGVRFSWMFPPPCTH